MDPDLLASLKALADASRLRIAGLLAEGSMTVAALAARLGLSPGAVVHHLERLRDGGLVEATGHHPDVEYRLRLGRLHEIGRDLDRAAREAEGRASADDPTAAGEGTSDAAESRVLRSFFEGGRLTAIPSQEKKRLVVLRHLAERLFDHGETYPEKEVNQRLAQLHPDVASLRRYLVDYGFMSRAGGQYRRLPVESWPS